MHQNVTALYRSHVTAMRVRRELDGLRPAPDAIRVIPDSPRDLDFSEFGVAAPAIAELHTLNLPPSDSLAYEERIRKGDYLVSVMIEGDATAEVETIMRRPEEIPSLPLSDVDEGSVPGRDLFSQTHGTAQPIESAS